mgnify:CR=1 FL=1
MAGGNDLQHNRAAGGDGGRVTILSTRVLQPGPTWRLISPGQGIPRLTIGYYSSNQTWQVIDVNHNSVAITWTGPGQDEPLTRGWTDGRANYATVQTWRLPELSGYFYSELRELANPTIVRRWIVRDPYGTPVAQRYLNGPQYYYLFDGQGDVVALEDPGQVQASYDYCPMGNEADLSGGTSPLTVAALGNPLRRGPQPPWMG